jgi:RND family efflux transporter MFP subunit
MVEQLDPLKVEVALPESESARVSVGDLVQVEIEALALRVEGRVDALVQAAETRSRSFRAKIVIANPAGLIGSGMFARAFFPGPMRDTLLMPSSALVQKGQLRGVYVAAGGRAHLRWLRLGKVYGQNIEVFSGLDEGDQIIVSPPADLREGRQVEVRPNG